MIFKINRINTDLKLKSLKINFLNFTFNNHSSSYVIQSLSIQNATLYSRISSSIQHFFESVGNFNGYQLSYFKRVFIFFMYRVENVFFIQFFKLIFNASKWVCQFFNNLIQNNFHIIKTLRFQKLSIIIKIKLLKFIRIFHNFVNIELLLSLRIQF